MRKVIVFTTLMVIVTGCGKSGNKTPEPAPAPGKAALLFPAKDEVCNQGTTVSATQNKVVFKWAGAANADSYTLTYVNLQTQASAVIASKQTQLEVSLDRGKPYSWYVTALSSANTAATTPSDTWKFYNSGPGTTSYAPFPAEAVSPANGASVTIGADFSYDIAWKATDVDNDIVNFDFYFGTTTSPDLYAGNITDSFIRKLPLKKGLTYYWKIVTRDSKGNSSDSGLFRFTTGN
jgi:hypothetical protein